MSKHFWFLVLMSAGIGQVTGQSFYDYKIDRRLIGSISIGAATYYGDIQSDPNLTPSTGQISLDYNAMDRLFLRVEGSLYWIGASDLGTSNESRGARFGAGSVGVPPVFSLVRE